jgi:hypothetical protein
MELRVDALCALRQIVIVLKLLLQTLLPELGQLLELHLQSPSNHHH